MKTHSFAAALLALPMGLALMGCNHVDTIKIGLAGVQTGPDGEIGSAPIRAAQIAIDEWNAKGGVLGKRIEAVVRDDEGKPAQAVSVAQELVSTGVAAVVGHWNSGCTLPASDIYAQAKILEITPASTNPTVTERGIRTLFRVCGRDDQQGAVSVLHNKSAYGQGIEAEFRKTFEAEGGKVVVFDGVSEDELDFRAAIADLVKAGAQAVFWGGMYNQGGPFYNQLRQAGFKGAFLGGDGIYDKELVKTVGASADSIFVTFGPDYNALPQARKLLEEYRTRFHQEPGGYTLYGYEAANTLLGAIRKAGTTDADKVAEALRSQEWPSLMGPLAFDGKGDLKKANFVVWTVRNGGFAVR
jgi:branched-chain amino acid transport system substrate-binding protein